MLQFFKQGMHLDKILPCLFMLVANCQSARYEIIGAERVSPTCNPDIDPKCDGGQKNNGLPSARVVVLKDKVEVGVVHINEPVIIRPTADSLDPEDLLEKTACEQNPGIVKAYYEIGEKIETQEIKRSHCEDLGINYVFKKAGEYKIYLRVTSNENENADASMILKVLDPGENNAKEDRGFYIVVRPLVVQLGDPITGQAFCQTIEPNTIEWDFGNNDSASGSYMTYRYQKTGQYIVKATCKSGTKIYVSWVTVSIVNFKVPLIVTPIAPPPTCQDPKNPIIINPGQGGSQNPNPPKPLPPCMPDPSKPPTQN